MKKNKISLAALVVTAVLVASFAFTSKPVTMRAFVYDPFSGNKATQTGVGQSLDEDEFVFDAEPNGVPDYWFEDVMTGHESGDFLMGIEFDDAEFDLAEAAALLRAHYIAFGSGDPLPTDGGQIVQPVTDDVVTYYKFD